MANLTLSVDAEMLQKARELALRDRTSVNALVRDYLTRYANAKSRRLDAFDELDALASRSKSRSTKKCSREELHQRGRSADRTCAYSSTPTCGCIGSINASPTNPA